MRIDVRGLFAAVVAAGHDASLGPDEWPDGYGGATFSMEVDCGGGEAGSIHVRADGVVFLDLMRDGAADDGLRATLDALAIVRSFLFEERHAP